MNCVINKTFNQLIRWFKPRQSIDIDIMIDVLESEIEHQEIKEILGIDLTIEDQLRLFLTRNQFSRFKRLSLYCDKRKSLLVLFTSMRLEKKLKDMMVKALLYPVFLFGISFIMALFVNGMLLKTFRSLLGFMGPDMSIVVYQSILNGIILLDVFLLMISGLCMFMFYKHKIAFYQIIRQFKPNNQWTRLLSHQFCLKFLHFYRLGETIDMILRQIKWSSDEVLSHRCGIVETLLEEGIPLHQAVKQIDPHLEIYFKMSDEGLAIEKYLENHNRTQELILMRQTKSFGKTVLAYAYLKITIIILVVYQLMLKPIEMMGNYL
jgi:type II secretory pathway component PulF